MCNSSHLCLFKKSGQLFFCVRSADTSEVEEVDRFILNLFCLFPDLCERPADVLAGRLAAAAPGAVPPRRRLASVLQHGVSAVEGDEPGAAPRPGLVPLRPVRLLRAHRGGVPAAGGAADGAS